ncbi:MAG: FHA domain-containing protein [Bacteroidales bacterium]|nr:FHA domain-containing protein [Bacteroidales bacterium]
MENQVAGWLVLHTEGKEVISFELKEGKNRIGRKTTQNSPEIFIDGDLFVSRNHAVLVVRKNEKTEYEYIIADNTEIQGKPSLNGTYINGNSERLGESPVKLKDGDTIQIGLTKFVLKTSTVAINAEDAIKLAAKVEYTNTVEFENSQAVLRKRC